MDKSQIKVGVGVLVFKNGKLLLSKRKNSHGEGEYECSGGHLEHMESFEDCARREVREEIGIELKNIRFLCLSNIKRYAPKQYIDIGLIAEWKSGEPQIMEPEKKELLNWYELENLPKPLFEPTQRYIDAYKNNKNFFDA